MRNAGCQLAGGLVPTQGRSCSVQSKQRKNQNPVLVPTFVTEYPDTKTSIRISAKWLSNWVKPPFISRMCPNSMRWDCTRIFWFCLCSGSHEGLPAEGRTPAGDGELLPRELRIHSLQFRALPLDGLVRRRQRLLGLLGVGRAGPGGWRVTEEAQKRVVEPTSEVGAVGLQVLCGLIKNTWD